MTRLNELPIQRLRFYLTAPYACSYLPDRQARSQVVASPPVMDAALFSELAVAGFRRSGHYVYRPRCDACAECVPARIEVAQFRPNRSQRRCWRRNSDLVSSLRPLEFDESHYVLYRRYQAARHAGGGMDGDDREQYRAFLLASPVDSALIEFSLTGETVMVSLVDRLPDGLSAVYAFYEPDLPRRSLGVFNVLTQIELARALGLDYLYLGYWIASSPKMAYKAYYRPLQVLRDGAWQPFAAEVGEGRSNG